MFLPGRLFGPNVRVRGWIGDLERRIHAERGAPSAASRFKSVAAVASAMWTKATLHIDWLQHPKLKRNAYRMPDHRWFAAWEELHRKVSSPDFSIRIELEHAREQVRSRRKTPKVWAGGSANH